MINFTNKRYIINMPYRNKSSPYRRVNANGGGGEEGGGEEGYLKKYFIYACVVCTCLAAFVIIGLVSFLVDRENNDDDDGAVKLPVEQSDFLDQFIENTEEMENFIRCLSGCGAGAATPCNTDTDCIDPEMCREICGGKFQWQHPPPGGGLCISENCSGNNVCEKICIRITVLNSCPLDCLCATKEQLPGVCPPDLGTMATNE